MIRQKPFIQERPSFRPNRFAERIKVELVDLVPADLRDPALYGLKLFTIVSVTVTPDLKHGNVLFCLMGQQKSEKQISQIEKALNKAAGFLRKELMKRLHTKVTPHLHFKYDSGFDKSFELDPHFKQIALERHVSEEE